MKAKDRRRQLLQVALELFAKRGYGGTTTADLASEAGVTEPILYRHFENKLDLFHTLIEEVSKHVLHEWKAALEQETEPKARLQTLLASNPATHARGRTAYRVIFHGMMEVESQEGLARTLRAHITKLHRFVESELAALQDAGIVRQDEAASDLAWLLVDVAVGHAMIMPIGGRGKGAPSRKNIQALLAELLAP